MSITTFVFDLGKLKADLQAMGSQAPLIMARALNRAAAAGQTATVRAVSADLGLTQKYVKREIRLDKANRSRPAVALEIRGSRIPLIAFSARGPEPSRGKGRGVSYRLPTGRGRIPDAFIATMGAGHRGVFKRRGKRRLPIVELRGPSIPRVFEKYLPTFRKAAEDALLKNLAHEIDFARRPAAGSGDETAAA